MLRVCSVTYGEVHGHEDAAASHAGGSGEDYGEGRDERNPKVGCVEGVKETLGSRRSRATISMERQLSGHLGVKTKFIGAAR